MHVNKVCIIIRSIIIIRMNLYLHSFSASSSQTLTRTKMISSLDKKQVKGGDVDG